MHQKTILFAFFLYAMMVSGQECPRLNFPANGSIDVPVDVTITWPAVDGIIGYLISLGTTPGSGDILNRRSAGLTNSFTPEVGLPENTLIHVTIALFIANQPLKICPGETFTTVDVTTPPPCTSLSNPVNNESGVSVTTNIEWQYASTATGYRLSLGSVPGGSDILDDFDVGNVLLYNPRENLPENEPTYVRIIPYNENGEPLSCIEESFTTGEGVFNCGPFLDPLSGQTVNLRPVVDFPNTVGLCQDNIPAIVSTTDVAHGFRWFRIHGDGSETLISSDRDVSLSFLGQYRYEAYNIIEELGTTIECVSVVDFSTVFSEIPVISAVNATRDSGGLQIEVLAEGVGNFEYALDQRDGPYQDHNVFSDIPSGDHNVYVRDKNGCGIAMEVLERELTSDDFPRFFTPNGDGINDYWQLKPTREGRLIQLEYLHVFNRYGALLAQVSPNSQGWDGNFNGRPLPATVYWFQAADGYKNIIKGYFLLKR